jgi:UDP-glucose 4-epimerase
LIFSSTAAVYGTPKYIPVDETHPTDPINVYGETKLACERNIEDVCTEAGIGHVSLRYFNVAGDAGLGYVDPHAENVIPIMMEVAFGEGDKFTILGDDYGTPDGTAVRDYIDIDDLVRAHILALDSDFNGVINLGSSEGISVLDLVKVTEEVTGRQVNYEFGPRREGDPSRVVASNELAQRELGWEPEKGI